MLALGLAAGLAWGGRIGWTGRRQARAMAEIESEIVAGRFAIACRDLETLRAWRGDPNGQFAFLLGSCERARGRIREADAVWAGVVPGSAFSEAAIRARMGLLQDAGRFADAERLIDEAAEDPRNEPSAVRLLLEPMFRRLGRLEEAARLIESRWERLDAEGAGALEPAIRLLRMHVELTGKAAPIEEVRAGLDAAARLAPEDDRIWLGRANLDIRTGDLDRAGRRLDACLRRRPEDVPTWRARLDWALAAGRAVDVREALGHLPAEEATPARIHRLRAWLASDRGDRESERRELDRLVAVDPADRSALERLARLAEQDGRPDRAAAWRARETEIDRLRARYEQLHARNQPSRDAVEMAGLAERLGREFEARGFLTLAIAEDSDRQDLRHDLRRLRRRPTTRPGRGHTLAELLATEPGDAR